MNPVLRNIAKQWLSIVTLFLLILSGCNDDAEPVKEEGLKKLWVVKLPTEIYYSSPALSADEKTVYIGTSFGILASPSANNVFVALNANTGNEIWKLPLEYFELRSSPAIAADHSLYLVVENRNPQFSAIHNELWHVSEQGAVLWKADINPSGATIQIGLSSPAIGLDGTVYVGGDKLYAINPDGTVRWSYGGPYILTGELLTNAPVIGKDGTVYFESHNFPLTAFDPATGAIRWSLTEEDHCFSSPAIADDGTIYTAMDRGSIYAISSTGEIKWTFNLSDIGYSGLLRSSPAIAADGTIYIGLNTGSPNSAFLALNEDGTLHWLFEPSGLPDDVPKDHFDIYSSPAIGADGVVYFGQEFGKVFGVRASNGELVSTTPVNSAITWSSPAISSLGILYISDLSGSVFAIETHSGGLDPQAMWPKYRYNNQNQGRVTAH